MNGSGRRLFIVALLAAQPLAAAAQIAPGRSGTSTMQTVTGESAWRDLSVFGACYAKSRTASAVELLSTRVGTREEVETYKRLFRKADQGCLGNTVQMDAPYQAVRGAIAEGVYKANIPLPAQLASPPPSAAEVRNLSDAARCYAAADPAKVRSLVNETWLGSRKEAAAVEALLPGLLRCAPPGATKALQVDPTIIRARLAEALWRNGAAAPAAAKVN